jgi:predicted metal-dependent phosphotriesterase family hydrolase
MCHAVAVFGVSALTGLPFVSAVVLPALDRKGVPPEVVRQMTVDNPRQWLVAGRS